MRYLTQHFSLSEFTASETAARQGIDNTLPKELEPAAIETARMLERIRDYLKHLTGREIAMNISSGYRCLQLNRAKGSKDTSDHIHAFAADFRAPSYGTATRVAEALASQVGALGIGQLILEFPESNGGTGGWVHVSTNPTALAINRIITVTGSGTFPGLSG